jgi:5'-deoxynucleotidase YfbR-like HD superfamily hydrolase
VDEHTIDTASGCKIDLDEPDASQIALKDIAGGLSRICRFGAQSVRFHSVAQHAVLVARLLHDGGHPHVALSGLHHDSHEAYVCDIPSPLKRKLTSAGETTYEQVCQALDRAIAARLALPTLSSDDQKLIKEADNKALMIEAADLLPDHGAGIANATGLPLEQPGQLDDSLDPDRACQQFRHIHEALRRPTR